MYSMVAEQGKSRACAQPRLCSATSAWNCPTPPTASSVANPAYQNGQPRPGTLPAGAVVVLHYSAKGPVSRILSCAVIPLGAALPRTLISDLPGGFGNCSSRLARIGPMRSTAWLLVAALPSLFGLAPCGVYPASGFTARSGALLPHHFTLTPARTGRPGEPARPFREALPRKGRGSRGGIFSVALAVREP